MESTFKILLDDGTSLPVLYETRPPMRMTLMFVTKQLADYWLTKNYRNRAIKQNIVNTLTVALQTGTFSTTHQGIAFDKDGLLIDGQHRLAAISRTGIGAWMYVFEDAPRDTSIDTGAKRTPRDSLYMAGVIDRGTIEYNQLTGPLINYIAKRALGQSTTITNYQQHIIYEKYKDLIDTIITMASPNGNGRTRRSRSSVVLYAMMCALYSGVEIETIASWYRVLATKDFFFEGNETQTKIARCVLLLANVLETARLQLSNSEEMIGIENKIRSSIYHFASGDIVTRIYGVDVYGIIPLTKEDIGYSEEA